MVIKVNLEDFDLDELKDSMRSYENVSVEKDNDRNFFGEMFACIDIGELLNAQNPVVNNLGAYASIIGLIVPLLISLLKNRGKSQNDANDYVVTLVDTKGHEKRMRLKDIEPYVRKNNKA